MRGVNLAPCVEVCQGDSGVPSVSLRASPPASHTDTKVTSALRVCLEKQEHPFLSDTGLRVIEALRGLARGSSSEAHTAWRAASHCCSPLGVTKQIVVSLQEKGKKKSSKQPKIHF